MVRTLHVCKYVESPQTKNAGTIQANNLAITGEGLPTETRHVGGVGTGSEGNFGRSATNRITDWKKVDLLNASDCRKVFGGDGEDEDAEIESAGTKSGEIPKYKSLISNLSCQTCEFSCVKFFIHRTDNMALYGIEELQKILIRYNTYLIQFAQGIPLNDSIVLAE